MSRSPYITVLLLICTVFLGGCRSGNTSIDSFLKDDTVRLEIDGVRVFVFDDNNGQLAYNEQRGVFRANTDTMLYYFELELDSIPQTNGDEVTGNVYWSTVDGERNRNRVTLNVKNIKGDLIWLCDAGGQTAAVVRVLK